MTKPNRTNKFTTGVCDIFQSDRDQRFCFFEIDDLNKDLFMRILQSYSNFNLDVYVHRTHTGWHFLSPTVVNLETWKDFHKSLRDINPKCPMTTLRVEPNKWPNESTIWYIGMTETFGNDPARNSYRMSIYLNHIFRTEFVGIKHGDIKIVRYPLPKLPEIPLVKFCDLNEYEQHRIDSRNNLKMECA